MADTPSPLSQRASGILLHPTCLPSRHGIGDLGESARRFADFLADCGQRYWQVLPLGPPGYGSSPYQCFSAMAGNPLLISLEALVQEGWLPEASLEDLPPFPGDFVDFAAVTPFKQRRLREAALGFSKRASPDQRHDLQEFCEQQQGWLEPFARFMALKEANGDSAWTAWWRLDADPAAIEAHRFIQFAFFRQWQALRRHCNGQGILIIGDIPIFVAHDSADVWEHPEYFDLDKDGKPRAVGGVPPDYFSQTGQLWGNPLYRWEVMAQTGYAWWIERIHATLSLVDIIRLDHFRGFEEYYAVPAGASTAIEGRWVEGPGEKLFSALRDALGDLPLIAEDLGTITPQVHALRDRLGFPGMRILQFAFSNTSPGDSFKPYNYVKNCVVYTGTHDNDTVVGWFTSSGPGDSTRSPEQVNAEREFALRYLNSDGRQIHWDFIRLALSSAANTAIIPLQDILGLGSEARMNRPGGTARNWTWRFNRDDLTPELAGKLRTLTATYGRCQ